VKWSDLEESFECNKTVGMVWHNFWSLYLSRRWCIIFSIYQYILTTGKLTNCKVIRARSHHVLW